MLALRDDTLEYTAMSFNVEYTIVPAPSCKVCGGENIFTSYEGQGFVYCAGCKAKSRAKREV